MKKILIYNNGCDDTTITIMSVSDEELNALIKFGKLNNKNSKYGCQPSINIYEEFEPVLDDDGDIIYYKYSKDLLEEA